MQFSDIYCFSPSHSFPLTTPWGREEKSLSQLLASVDVCIKISFQHSNIIIVSDFFVIFPFCPPNAFIALQSATFCCAKYVTHKSSTFLPLLSSWLSTCRFKDITGDFLNGTLNGRFIRIERMIPSG